MPTNPACQELIRRGIDKNRVFTFDSYFQENKKIPDNIKNIFVDEFSMLSQKWLRTLYKLKLYNQNITIQLYGDSNQCEPVENIYQTKINDKKDEELKKVSRYFNYIEKKCFKFIVDYNLIALPYIEETARYDKQLCNALSEFLETGVLPKVFNKPINDKLTTNICYYNGTRFTANSGLG